MMSAGRTTSRGFTLIELLLVLVLLTLVVSAVVPNFSKFSIGRQAKYTSTAFLALTRYARSAAISEGRTHRINFDQQAFWVTIDDGSGVFVELKNEYGKRHELPANVKMDLDVQTKEDAGQVLDFTPDGLGDVGRVSFTSANGEVTAVASQTASDLYRVVDPTAPLTLDVQQTTVNGGVQR